MFPLIYGLKSDRTFTEHIHPPPRTPSPPPHPTPTQGGIKLFFPQEQDFS